ncbi:hypothetical protein M422DRAFT_260278 [Sphaerobolus stellatus SS14]|uniref:Uncharacterized protein n=1 Tax=Sphaerobolus stellatus (strain SS14) TaxID=990650 RepID=A0A0C9VIH4_SPHS4|nr:hypothetical protein M422DRAFT_260278 [Sphaerobolus stellatus SS14]
MVFREQVVAAQLWVSAIHHIVVKVTLVFRESAPVETIKDWKVLALDQDQPFFEDLIQGDRDTFRKKPSDFLSLRPILRSLP